MSEMSAPGSPAPRRGLRGRGIGSPATSWTGCLVWTAAFLVVTVGGCVAGLSLRPDDGAPVTVAEGQGWKVQVRTDDVGDACAELFVGGNLRAGQCGFATGGGGGGYRATSYDVGAGLTVIFGPVPPRVVRVRLRLADGRRVVVPVQEHGDVRAFVHRSRVADKGPTELLDAQGRTVRP